MNQMERGSSTRKESAIGPSQSGEPFVSRDMRELFSLREEKPRTMTAAQRTRRITPSSILGERGYRNGRFDCCSILETRGSDHRLRASACLPERRTPGHLNIIRVPPRRAAPRARRRRNRDATRLVFAANSVGDILHP